MIVLGLTGSMGMGKSTVTKMMRSLYHLPVWDADQAVRELWASDPHLLQEIEKLYPKALHQGKIDRSILRDIAFNDEDCLKALEDLVHERVLVECQQFIEQMQRMHVPLCVIDVPLLFELGWERLCAHTIVVYAPSFIQRQRLKKRSYLSEKNIRFLLGRQENVAEKKKKATYQIQTGLTKGHTFRQLNRIIRDIKSRQVRNA